jgi:hypothetical protein
MLLSLTITAAVDNTVPLFKDIVDNWGAGTEETTVLFRNTNPIQDIIEQEKVNRILSDPGHNSFAQYADYPVEYADSPRLTGNAFADIALLNSAGLQDNHS